MSPNFNEKIKNSFWNIKKDIENLNNEISSIKSVLEKQNEVLKILLLRVQESYKASFEEESEENNDFFVKNEENEGLNKQTNTKQTLNKHLNTKIKIAENGSLEPEFDSSIGNNGVKHILNTSQNNEITTKSAQIISNRPKTAENNENKDLFDYSLKTLKLRLEGSFSRLTKQELKVFLTIYQLNSTDEGVGYLSLSSNLKLSETCIRVYVRNLIKKGIPLIKHKINNKTTLISVEKDFKTLNMKDKIINLYYKTDPYQKTLFDL